MDIARSGGASGPSASPRSASDLPSAVPLGRENDVVSVDVLLWDFGDTLVDERWMLRAPDDVPIWPAAWEEVMAELAEDWEVGRAACPDIFDALASRTGMSTAAVAAHARECCRRLKFNPTAWQVARERRRPQALVTVNPDLFVEHIVGEHDLTSVFNAVVVSSVEGTADKVELCARAIERLGLDGDKSGALLIDNRVDLVEAWQRAGGAGYWFRSDEQFAHDIQQLLAGVTSA
jgi:phosphoglycolate phosphatase-like HAD superfamily hydrolase